MTKRTLLPIAVIAASVWGFAPQARAEAAVGIIATAPLSAPAAIVAAPLAVLGHELTRDRPFGPNGEGAKHVRKAHRWLKNRF